MTSPISTPSVISPALKNQFDHLSRGLSADVKSVLEGNLTGFTELADQSQMSVGWAIERTISMYHAELNLGDQFIKDHYGSNKSVMSKQVEVMAEILKSMIPTAPMTIPAALADSYRKSKITESVTRKVDEFLIALCESDSADKHGLVESAMAARVDGVSDTELARQFVHLMNN